MEARLKADALYVFEEFGQNLVNFLVPYINKNKPEVLVFWVILSKHLIYFLLYWKKN
jgi:hypothetical protein